MADCAAPIDLRTDFIGRPTAEMQRAMSEAAGEPCGFHPGENWRERALESRAAELLGKPRALFCPTCTMANQIAIHLHCRPGDMILAEADAHAMVAEAGATPALTGAGFRAVDRDMSGIDLTALEAALEQGAAALILVENTHVRSGGTVTSLDRMQAVARLAAGRGVPVHLDGSRLFNAAVALGVPAADLSACADTVSVSLNKGLGAPQGAILAGEDALIAEALRVRQMLGGAWRPAPTLCAAALVALNRMPGRLGEDHANAARLADLLSGLSGAQIQREALQTNILLLDIRDPGWTAATLTAALAQEDLLVMPLGPRRIRMVTRHDIGAEDVERAAAILSRTLETPNEKRQSA